MTDRFKTETGSWYEVDRNNKMARRVSGEGDPTPRVNEDGVWQGYLTISSVGVGLPVIIVWRVVGVIAKSTMTSRVVEVVEGAAA